MQKVLIIYNFKVIGTKNKKLILHLRNLIQILHFYIKNKQKIIVQKNYYLNKHY